ncbi:cytochrome C oxidase subunit IV family protein [Brucella sp. IR073]|uniref:cytochrome C oxidase subunit IV family protein n=1 Tax=unclassified Brucella TaxID=2632610 RepID=UPI003B9803B2
MPFDLARVWAVLVVLSLATLLTGFAGWPALAANTTVLFIAIAKARFILLDFLELRHVPRMWRTLFWWWLALVCGAGVGVSFWRMYGIAF